MKYSLFKLNGKFYLALGGWIRPPFSLVLRHSTFTAQEYENIRFSPSVVVQYEDESKNYYVVTRRNLQRKDCAIIKHRDFIRLKGEKHHGTI